MLLLETQPGSTLRPRFVVFHNALEQARLADELGFDASSTTSWRSTPTAPRPLDPDPLSAGDAQYTGTLTLAETPLGYGW